MSLLISFQTAISGAYEPRKYLPIVTPQLRQSDSVPPLAGCKVPSLTEVQHVATVLVAINVKDGAGAEYPDAKQNGVAGLVLREVAGFAIVRRLSGSDS